MPRSMWLVIAYLAVVGLGLLIFLKGKPEGNSIYDKMYRVACQHIPNFIKGSSRMCCGTRGPQFIDRAWNYVVWSNNPFVQIFYLVIILTGYVLFTIHGYPHIPNVYLGEYHKHCGFCVFVWCLYNFGMASWKDPGLVTNKNYQALMQVFPPDGQIFAKNNECSTCKFDKPGRSKHCALCNWCIAKFDHHCIWINSCVGLGNHYYFLNFLFSNCLICLYGFYLGGFIIYDYVDKKQLFDAVFIDPKTQERFEASWYVIGQYLLATNGYLFFIVVLCGIMGVVLLGFWGWHMYLVLVGTTTNEQTKRNGLISFLGDKFDSEVQEYNKLATLYNSQQDRIHNNEALKDNEEILERPDQPTDYRTYVQNIYHMGWWGNLKLVIFPPDIHSDKWIREQMTCQECRDKQNKAKDLFGDSSNDEEADKSDSNKKGLKKRKGGSGTSGSGTSKGGSSRGSGTSNEEPAGSDLQPKEQPASWFSSWFGGARPPPSKEVEMTSNSKKKKKK